ncbi:MAG: hypothetical protein AABZ39_20685 [Spirochaetota bacterium]
MKGSAIFLSAIAALLLLNSCVNDVTGRTNPYDPQNPNFVSGKNWFQSTTSAFLPARAAASCVGRV